jgi:hypothetical protein
MSVSSVGASTGHPSSALQVQQAAKAQYVKTGIDKDAALGDPDHDASRKAAPRAAPTVSASALTATASAATTAASTAPSGPVTTHAAAAAAYSATAPNR